MIATSIDTCTRSAYDISECSSMSVAHGRSGPNLATLTARAAYSSIGAAARTAPHPEFYLNAIWRVRWLVKQSSEDASLSSGVTPKVVAAARGKWDEF